MPRRKRKDTPAVITTEALAAGEVIEYNTFEEAYAALMASLEPGGLDRSPRGDVRHGERRRLQLHADSHGERRRGVTAVAAPAHKALKRAGAYADRCVEFADALGWDAGIIAQWWEQFSMMRMREAGWPRPLAEWMAWRDVLAFFDKRGNQEPD